MKYLSLWLLMVSSLSFAESNSSTTIYIHKKEMQLPGHCTYYAHSMDERSFNCDVGNQPSGYTLNFSSLEKLKEENESAAETSRIYEEQFGDYQHIYKYVLDGDLEGFVYSICSPKICATFTSLNRELIKQLVGALETDYIYVLNDVSLRAK